jgi:putative iron-regulated protein
MNPHAVALASTVRRHAQLSLMVACLVAAPTSAQAAVSRQAVVENYAAIVFATYEDTAQIAKLLQRSVHAFVARPTSEALQATKKAWIDARERYDQTEAFRFYGGPIDDADGPEPRLNSWPVDESYIDSVDGNPGSGIINDPRVEISKRHLSAMNERGGQENIATGWHAIEFLLWGQDFNDDGPGERSFEDFVDGKGRNAERRRKYLETVMDLLIDDLDYLVAAWHPGRQNYRAAFVGDPDESLRRMVVGIGSLASSEMAGERMEVPLATQDQEDEQSCFSDNTHRDLFLDQQGIENIWRGRYVRLDGTVTEGPSLRDLVAEADPRQAEKTTADVAAALKAIGEIRAPFDQEIRGGASAPGRQRVQAAIDGVKTQTADFVASARALAITRLTIVSTKR